MIWDSVLWMVAMFAILALIETVLNLLHRDNEASRKAFHIMHAIGLVGLAFIVPLSWLIVFESFFLFAMFVARYLNTHYDKRWKWVHYLGKTYRVGRTSYGDLLWPASVILTAFIANTKWEFIVAVLVVGLADAAAALVGKKWGKSSSYTIFGQQKSVLGSVAFFVVAVLVVYGYSVLSPTYPGDVLPLLAIAALLTGIENIGVYGSDNFLLPIVTVWIFNSF